MKNLLLILTGVLVMLSGCGANRVEYYKGSKPEVDIKEYFNGNIKAWGVVQDWRGRVVNRFDVDMVGVWSGMNGTLDEEFHYYDGKTMHRTWHLTKNSDGTYTGKASDIIGDATGKLAGSAVNWNYQMDVPVDGKTYRLTFDDWMWHMNDGVVVNRSYLKKFGITVAELTIFMQKKGK